MKKITLSSLLTALFSVTVVGAAFGHPSSVTISAPVQDQVFMVDTLPTNIVVNGDIFHSNNGNVDSFLVCIIVDDVDETCEPAAVPVGGNAGTRPFEISVPIATAGPHTLQASTNKPGDDNHGGLSDTVSISIVLTQTVCDTMAPPAFANLLMNDLNLPKQYAKFRGQVIRVIAFNHSNGKYESCNYDYDQVEDDVLELLKSVGFPG